MERIRLEIKRQPIHILLGLLIIILIKRDILTVPILVASIIVGLLASVWVKKKKPKRVYSFLEHFERKEALEAFPGKGMINYLVGALIVFVLFDKDIAMASIIILALGDSFSRLIGPFGRIKHPFNDSRFLEGVIAGMAAAALGAMLFVKPLEAVIASSFAMLLEGIELRPFGYKIDDNITIPFLAGSILWLIRTLNFI